MTVASLERDLADLPGPAPPPDLAGTIMARVAQIDTAMPADSTAQPGSRTGSDPREWRAWAPAVGAATAVATSVLLPYLSGTTELDLAAPGFRLMTMGLAAEPTMALGILLLEVSLALYVAGLFVPLGTRSR